jgi:hypothetical protein
LALVDEFEALRSISRAALELDDPRGAWSMAAALVARLGDAEDPDLEIQKTMVARLERTLAARAGLP